MNKTINNKKIIMNAFLKVYLKVNQKLSKLIIQKQVKLKDLKNSN
jgi:hypothetical protein